MSQSLLYYLDILQKIPIISPVRGKKKKKVSHLSLFSFFNSMWLQRKIDMLSLASSTRLLAFKHVC